MTLSRLGLGIGFSLLVIYTIIFVYKRRAIPSLGVIFLLFTLRPVVDEAFAIIAITKKLYYDKMYLDTGIFQNHVHVIAFSAVALIYATAETTIRTFEPIFRQRSSPPPPSAPSPANPSSSTAADTPGES